MAGQQRRSGDLDQQKAQRTGLRQRAVQEGKRGGDCRKRKVISHHRRRTRRHHSPKHNAKCSAWLWLNIDPKTTRYTFIFVVIAAQQSPMTRQTPHAHATRCAHSDFNLFLPCTTFAVQLQTYSKIAYCLQFNCKHVSKLHFACSSPANITQNCILLAELPQI